MRFSERKKWPKLKKQNGKKYFLFIKKFKRTCWLVRRQQKRSEIKLVRLIEKGQSDWLFQTVQLTADEQGSIAWAEFVSSVNFF